jgi:hypothetical protein
MGLECRRSCAVARLGLVYDRMAPWNDDTDDQASLQARGATQHVGGRQARAIGLTDVDRSSPLSQNWRKEMTNELDRLLTITDLSEMLGVPVGTLYRGAPPR